MYKNFLILIITGLGFAAITSASPTCAPPSCNIPIPIFGNDASTPSGGIFTGPQSKPGLPATGSGLNLVAHALSVGPASFPSSDATLYTNSLIKFGSLDNSNDSLVSRSSFQVGGKLTIQKTAPAASDGKMTIGGLSSSTISANRPICVNTSKQVIVCP